MDQNHRNSIAENEDRPSMSADINAMHEASISPPTTTGFAPISRQVNDPASVASDVLLVINGHHVRLSQQLAAYYDRKKSWLTKIFPTALDRVLADSQLRQAKTECALNERLLALATEMKYEACREVGEAWVKSLRVGVREQFIVFVTERFQSLKNTIEARRKEFGLYMRDRYKTRETYRDMPELSERYKESMDREIEQYFAWLDQLLSGFQSIIDQKLGEYNHDSSPSS